MRYPDCWEIGVSTTQSVARRHRIPEPAEEPAADDHRVRVARERRDRMRRRLLTAVMESYAKRLENGPPSVDHVIEAAGVSRATFYRSFSSTEEAIATLGGELVDEMVHSLITLYDGTHGPFFRLSAGIQLFFLRSAADPLWAAFVSRADFLAPDTDLLKGITTHLALSHEQGFIEVTDIESATTLVVGSLMEGVRHLVHGGRGSRPYVENLTVLILRGLGVDHGSARDVVSDRTRFIRDRAPSRLGWWRDPWA